MIATTHPHPDKRFIMQTYRQHILDFKRKNGSARSLVHYKSFVQIYLHCKRGLMEGNATLLTEASAMLRALKGFVKYGKPDINGDWACRECRPYSDIIKGGFQCCYHLALSIIERVEGAGVESGKP